MIRTKITLGFILFLNAFNLVAQKTDLSLKQTVDSVLNYTRTRSIYKDQIDWNAVTKNYIAKTKNAQSKKDLIPAFLYLQEKLGDFHAKVVENDTIIHSYNASQGHPPRINAFIEILQQQGGQMPYYPVSESFYHQLLDNGYAYMNIPGNNGFCETATTYFNEIQKAVLALEAKKPKGWILDFRQNTGGCLFPMVCSLSGFLPEGSLGRILSGNGTTGPFHIENGTLTIEDGSTYYYGNPKEMSSKKIAVLTSPITASSGEQTIIAMKANPNIRIFGETTSGYISGVDWIAIGDGIQYGISTGYYEDAKGKAYRKDITPDEEVIGGDNFIELMKDAKINKALLWMEQ